MVSCHVSDALEGVTTVPLCESMPGPFYVSGRRAHTSASLGLLKGLLCIGSLMATIWLTVFVCLCLLLRKANTEQVHRNCPGLWDFTLVSILSPFIVPLIFLMTTSVLTLSWSAFSAAWLVAMSLFSLAFAFTSSMSFACVETLRDITPPFPWLLFVGWVKSIMYLAGALSSLRGLFSARR